MFLYTYKIYKFYLFVHLKLSKIFMRSIYLNNYIGIGKFFYYRLNTSDCVLKEILS